MCPSQATRYTTARICARSSMPCFEKNDISNVSNKRVYKKSSCLRVGSRHKVTCAEITTSGGNNLPWVNEIRYLGIFIVSFFSFRCSTDHAKRSFYRAANAIFAKDGRFASEEVILELILKKMFTNPYLWIGGVCFA